MRPLLRAAAAACLAALPLTGHAGFNLAVFVPVPTLDEVGLGLLIALVAGVAGWAVRKRTRR